jgi:hypothetical protein
MGEPCSTSGSWMQRWSGTWSRLPGRWYIERVAYIHRSVMVHPIGGGERWSWWWLGGSYYGLWLVLAGRTCFSHITGCILWIRFQVHDNASFIWKPQPSILCCKKQQLCW